SATRTMAPTLPGSWTSVAITTSGDATSYARDGSAVGASTSATIWLGDRTGLSAAITTDDAVATVTRAAASGRGSALPSARSAAPAETTTSLSGAPAAKASSTR